MCNSYSLTKGQAAIIALVRAMCDRTGNLPPMPGIFPDFLAPIARNAPDGVRELVMARWGMPGPRAYAGSPITNIRNVKSPNWRAWLNPQHRCVVPFTSFCEYAGTKPRKTPTGSRSMMSGRWPCSPASGRSDAANAGRNRTRLKASTSFSDF
jgi:putative SOS response-associated peptidase YedK